MVPPKYNFYVSTAGEVISFTKNTFIENDGSFEYSAGNYASDYVSVMGSTIMLDYVSYDTRSAIFFYDSTRAFISKIDLNTVERDASISVPSNAKYMALRFSGADKTFLKYGVSGITWRSLRQVIPHYKSLSKKWSKESNQEFFRTSLDGKITLFGSDFEFIYNADIEDDLSFTIQKYDKKIDDYKVYCTFKFSKADCKFDYSKKSCELKLSEDDEYSKILDGYDNTYDLIKLAPATSSIDIYKRSLVQIYIKGSSSISNFFGGTYWEEDVDEVIDSTSDLTEKYNFAFVKQCNEIYISGSSNKAINGVYAGLNMAWTLSSGDYYIEATASDDDNFYWVDVKRTSDKKLMYRSEFTVYISEEEDIAADKIKLVNPNNTNDTAVIDTIFSYLVYQRLLFDVEKVQGLNAPDLPYDDFASNGGNYKKCIGLVSGSIHCSASVVDEPTKYGQNDDGKYFTNNVIPSSTGLGRALPICRSSWTNASIWYTYSTSYDAFEKKLRKKYTLKDAYSIASVIKALLSQIDPSISHEATAEYSNFLYGSNNRIRALDFSVYITQKTNILKGNYDQAARKAEISLKDVMDMLRDCFRCYWYIENNMLKIEHITFFMNGRSYSSVKSYKIDFTSLIDAYNKKPVSYFQSDLSYDKSNLPARYEFAWMDDSTEAFDGTTLDVVSNYVQKDKTESINISQFSSDIDFMLFNPSNFSNDGFALLCPTTVNSKLELPILSLSLIDENGDSYTATIQNAYASWPFLIEYYKYDMPAKKVNCNAVKGYSVSGVKMSMAQTVLFLLEEDIDMPSSIKTLTGIGQIGELSINIDTRLASAKLEYEPK